MGFGHLKDTELEVGVAKSTGRPTSVTYVSVPVEAAPEGFRRAPANR
jgi:hypothetical protein